MPSYGEYEVLEYSGHDQFLFPRFLFLNLHILRTTNVPDGDPWQVGSEQRRREDYGHGDVKESNFQLPLLLHSFTCLSSSPGLLER